MSCFVCALVDPIDESIFYIGISQNPWYRFYSHHHDRCSAAYNLLNALLGMDYTRDDILLIVKECTTRREAFDIEYRLVTSIEGLCNRPYKRGRSYT